MAEGIRGLYRGSLLALVGVSNGSIQFATYEEIKTRRAALKRRTLEREGRTWTRADEKLVRVGRCMMRAEERSEADRGYIGMRIVQHGVYIG